MSFVSFITEMAENADWRAVRVVSDSLVVLPFTTDQGTINVFIRPCGQVQGKTVIEFSSDGIDVPTTETLKLGLMQLLLVRNAKITVGHWAIEGGETTEPRFAVMATQIAETMDPAEFTTAVRAVTNEYEFFLGALRKINRNRQIDF